MVEINKPKAFMMISLDEAGVYDMDSREMISHPSKIILVINGRYFLLARTIEIKIESVPILGQVARLGRVPLWLDQLYMEAILNAHKRCAAVDPV